MGILMFSCNESGGQQLSVRTRYVLSLWIRATKFSDSFVPAMHVYMCTAATASSTRFKYRLKAVVAVCEARGSNDETVKTELDDNFKLVIANQKRWDATNKNYSPHSLMKYCSLDSWATETVVFEVAVVLEILKEVESAVKIKALDGDDVSVRCKHQRKFKHKSKCKCWVKLKFRWK